MMTRTGVGAVLCAAHRSVEGQLHGHTWEITAWFPSGADAFELQRLLVGFLAQWDHAELPAHLSRGEHLAAAIGQSLSMCVQVDVSRPPERIFARWHL